MGVKANVPFLQPRAVAAPAAGAEFTISAPGQGLWRVVSLAFRLVTDANVANRAVSLVASDGTTTVWRASASAVQAAGVTIDHGVYAGSSAALLTGSVAVFALPSDGLLLLPGWSLRSVTGNIQAGDQYSAIGALVEEFPNGPGNEWQPTVPRGEYERS